MRQPIIILVICLSFTGFAGCDSPAKITKPAQPAQLENRRAQEPALKQINEVNVGDVMYSEFMYQSGSAAQITRSNRFIKTILFGDVKLTPETLLEREPTADYPTYCSTDKVYYPMNGKDATDIACFADEDEDGWFDRVQIPSIKFGTWTRTEDGPAYKVQAVERKTQERRELLYQGRAGSTIKLAYREYDARSELSASQQVEYTLNGTSTTVGFKKARLEIESADNTKIRYQVLTGF